MKYIDRNYNRWQKRQQATENDIYYQQNRHNKKVLDRFCVLHIEDKLWWRILSRDERIEVYQSYQNTLENFKRKINGENVDDFWYSHDPNIADVSGADWKECLPQWVEYIQEKYPQDAVVRRELAIRRIFS